VPLPSAWSGSAKISQAGDDAEEYDWLAAVEAERGKPRHHAQRVHGGPICFYKSADGLLDAGVMTDYIPPSPGPSHRLILTVFALLISIAAKLPAQARTSGLFTYSETSTSITITDYPTTAVGAVNIPSSINGKPVTSIGTQAFYGCFGLTSVTIPNGVTSIGTQAFYVCSSLTSVTIPNGVTSIGDQAFDDCISLISVTIPNGVTSIGYGTFSGCWGLTSVTIPNGVTSIGGAAFYDCRSLTSVTIPNGVTSIGSAAFYDCRSLTSVTIPNGVTSIGARAFSGCWGLTRVIIPTGVTSIGNQAFYECRSLTSVTIPNGVTSIEYGTFSRCWGLTSVTIPAGVTSIGSQAFSECWRLPDMRLPSSLTDIGREAFADCSSLREVAIPSKVTVISTHAFQFCANLEKILFLGDAPSMGANAFYGAKPGLTIYHYDGRNGFTSPTWYGYPSVNLGAWRPASLWLWDNGFPPDTDMLSDANNDGVILLLSYALNLNPNINLSGKMPKSVLSGGKLSISFFAGREDINYTVETSMNLKDWTTSGVTLGDLDQNQHRTATVAASSQSRFLRLVVVQ